MTRCVVLSVLLAAVGVAQNCQIQFGVESGRRSLVLDNRKSACARWAITYSGTASIRLEFSSDSVTWSTGYTVTSGVMPTPAGFGVVEASGYAPYVSIVALSSPAGRSSGVVKGIPAVSFSAGSAVVIPNWIDTSYPPLVPSDWAVNVNTSGITRTDDPTRGMIRIRVDTTGGAPATQQHFICRPQSFAGDVTVRLTADWVGQRWYLDGGAVEFGIALRNSGTGEWISSILYADTAVNWATAYCPSIGGACSFTPVTGNTLYAARGTTVPATFEVVKTGSNYGVGFRVGADSTWRFHARDALPSGLMSAAPDQVCFTFTSPNGNYDAWFRLLGFEVS